MRARLRRPLPQPEPDQALLAELCRLPQVHPSQGRGLCSLPPGTLSHQLPHLSTSRETSACLTPARPQFYLAYRSLCPGGWTQRWDDQRGKCPSPPPLPAALITTNMNRGRQLPRQARPVDAACVSMIMAECCFGRRAPLGAWGARTSGHAFTALYSSSIANTARMSPGPDRIPDCH